MIEKEKNHDWAESSTNDQDTATSAAESRMLPERTNFLKRLEKPLTNTAVRNPRDYPVLGRFKKQQTKREGN